VATSVAAACLGIDGRTGSMKAGLEADLIVVDHDPIVNPRALGSPVLVVNNGRIAINRLAR
jgi:imidazolonepropionase-like amidohydrolase